MHHSFIHLFLNMGVFYFILFIIFCKVFENLQRHKGQSLKWGFEKYKQIKSVLHIFCIHD